VPVTGRSAMGIAGRIFACSRLAVGDDVFELVGDGMERGRARRCGRVCGKSLALVLERVKVR
jgi:hypothetical protein